MVLVLTSCTNRKRRIPEPGLEARNLPSGTLEQTADRWVALCQQSNTLYEAGSLYIGRPIKDARQAARQFGTSIYVLSAGMGLVSETDRIPAYDLTIQEKSRGSIHTKIVEPIRPMDWWEALNSSWKKEKPLSSLIRLHPDELVLIACPEVYAQMITFDLLALDDDELMRVRLFGPRNTDSLSVRLRDITLPYDERFDGTDSPLSGTRIDFPQRILLHFATEILPHHPTVNDLATHRNVIKKLMNEMRRPQEVQRKTMNDEEIIQLIKKCWIIAEGKSSKMLRVLRDQEKVACEQSRFANLFKVARERYTL